LTFGYKGFVNDDNADDLTTKPTASTTVDALTNAGVYTGAITLAGGSANNYIFTYQAGNFTINLKELKVIADNKTKTYGDASPALTFGYDGFVNDDNADDLTTKPTASTTVNALTNAGVYTGAIALAGGVANNYTFAYQAGNFTINPKELKVIADNKTKTYGEANPALTFGYDGFVNDDNTDDLTTIPLASTTVDALTNAGVYTGAITLAGGVADNYTFTYLAGNFTINTKELKVTADNKTKTYGDVNPALTFGYEGFVNDDNADDLTTKPTASTTVDVLTGAGVYTSAITLAGGAANNYTFTYQAGNFTINPKELKVIADNKTKTYGDANPALTFGYEGFVNGDDAEDLTTIPMASTTVDALTNAGVYTGAITLAGGAANNYTFTYLAGNLTINPKELKVIADNKTKTYGDANPALTFGYEGFVNDDDVSELNELPAAESPADLYSNVGNYPIIVSGGNDNNYTFIYENGSLQITARTLTLNNFKVDNKEYDGTTNVSGTSFDDDRLNNDNLEFTFSASFADKNVGDVKTVNFANIAITGGTAMLNYSLAENFGTATADIISRVLTISGSFTVSDKEYDGTTSANIEQNNLQLNDVINNETVVINPIATFASAEEGDEIEVSLADESSLSGADKDNYTLSLDGAPTTTASIYKTAVTKYTLTLNVTGNGTVKINGAEYTSPVIFDAGTKVGIEAYVAYGWQFAGWSGGFISSLATDSVLMDADKTITAGFTEIVIPQFSVNFMVTNGTTALPGASIEIDGKILTTDDDGKVATTMIDGEYPYTVTLQDYVAKQGNITVNGADVTEQVTLTLSSAISKESDQVIAYPNPFKNYLNIEHLNGMQKIVISNIIGEKLFEVNVPDMTSYRLETNLPTGIYFISLLSGNGEKITLKVIREE
jgi:hypothetical protein